MMSRILREPLVHFLIIGALIFAVFAAVAPSGEDTVSDATIHVDTATAERLAGQYRQIWRRAPTQDELDALIAAFVREEVLVREALSLSMDENDAIIRQRLAQKMTFLLEATAGAEAPDDDTLRAYYEENAADYLQPGRIAFDQVYLGDQISDEDLAAAKIALAAGQDPQTPQTLLPPSIPLSSPAAIDGLLGAGFFDAIADLPGATWAGPIQSGYGLHLVRLTDRRAPEMPSFEAYRERIEADWREMRTREITEDLYSSMARGYDISRPDPADLEPLTR